VNHSVVIRGERALFARPDCTDPLSYPTPPPSALRGIFGSVYWHPGLYIDVIQIKVLAPIRWDREGITETRGSKQASDPKGATLPRLNLRAGTFEVPLQLLRVTTRVVLRDPAWLVKFRFCRQGSQAPPLVKADTIFKKRLLGGLFFDIPSLGIEEYGAIVAPPTGDEKPIHKSRDFGLVLHDFDYRENPPVQHVYRARMVNGVIQVPSFFDRVLSRARRAA
jgi:CRISPR-associated protein Cas5 subtype I-C